MLIPAGAFIGDSDANLVSGDLAATLENHNGRAALAFDATDEEAALSPEYIMPEGYGGSTLKAGIVIAADSDTTNGCVFDVFVEAKTPSSDTIDMETADSWDLANSSGDIDLSGTTAGDPILVTITLTNKDSVAAGDLVRFGIRRDTDHANDDASGDIFLYSVRIYEDA
jgi:hypothetical protein